MRDGMGQKNGRGDKREMKTTFISLKLLWDYWISSKNGLLDTYVTTQSTRPRP